MEKLINLCINALSEIYGRVVVRKADTSNPQVRKWLFQKLFAVWYAASCMIKAIGYTDHDVVEMVKKLEVAKDSQGEHGPTG